MAMDAEIRNPESEANDGCAESRAAMSDAEPIIRMRGVHKRFGPLTVLNGLDLDFRPHETTVLLGPSGTGKSVTLKHIVGLLQPDAGEVYFHDQRVDQLKERELVPLRKRIGFLFQMGAMFDSMTVGQNVEFPLVEHTNLNRRQRAEKVDRLLKMVGLGKTQDKMPNDMSGGQRKRAALARAIALEPEVMLYDEPTTGLDPIRSDVINELILALTKQLGMTSIVVTHDMNSANKIADRMVLLYDGQVAADSDPCTFRNSKSELVQRFIRGQADQQDIELIRMGFEEGQAPNIESAGEAINTPTPQRRKTDRPDASAGPATNTPTPPAAALQSEPTKPDPTELDTEGEDTPSVFHDD
ncbi:MAG: ATP-binding cassette domain-containing protein [Planctomycetota bacterium]